MKDDYIIVPVCFEVGVTVRYDVDQDYGADADGNRGTVLTEVVAEKAEILTQGVPEPLQGLIKTMAMDQVEGKI